MEKETKEEKKQKQDKMAEQLEKLLSAYNDANDKLLRVSAEMQNYKRRKEEETSNMLKYANEDLAKDLLPIIDNFERAIMMDDKDLTNELSRFLSGFKMIYSSFIELLNKYGIKEIETSGQEFNPNYHQAVLTEKDENKPSGVVLEVLQKGYIYKDKVIRPAMVKVNE